MYLETWVQLDKVATFSTSRCYRLTWASYFSEIFSKRSSDIGGKCISLVLVTNCFVKKQIWRNTYLKPRIGATFIIVECPRNIQFVCTEDYSINTTRGEGDCINFWSLAHYNFSTFLPSFLKGFFPFFFYFACCLFWYSFSDQEFSQTFFIATWFGPLTIA